MKVNAYLNFDGRCEEAFNFYAKVLGAKVLMMIKHGDTPVADQMPGWRDKIVHARLDIGGTLLMGSDSPPQYQTKPAGFSVNIDTATPAEAERVFAALAEGADVRMPIGETFWVLRFGMLIDRYGTPWMVNCEKPMD